VKQSLAVDLYLAVKFLHVVGAAILFGTGLGIAFFLFRAQRQERPEAVAATLRTVVVLQIRMRDLAESAVAANAPALPPAYRRLARLWFWLGWPAFLSVLAIFWLMIAKPM
jgi:uncharacterized membrane protein